MSINSNLGIGPMSSEIIEAVYRYSNYRRAELMLIASKNQIDYAGGYVNKWTTKQYADFLKEMKAKYPQSNVKVCRDHCGPGFNGIYDLSDVYKTIGEDIKNGFDLIHIDFCNHKGTKEEKLIESEKAIKKCLELNPNIELEIGTDENAGTNFGVMNIQEIEGEVDFFLKLCKPNFYVVQTGSLIKEINQAGNFNKEFIEKISKKLKEKGVKLKEHNGDYLSREEIEQRKGIVDAINIAPQLGVVQTSIVISKCLIYGIKFDDFIDEVYAGGKWRKWLQNNTQENKFLCSIIGGHYHFSSDNYKKLIIELAKREDIQENIITNILEVINHYQEAQNGK